MAFLPPCCPNPLCDSQREEVEFSFQHVGSYARKCDRRVVRRFKCCLCGKRCSEQTFRADYRQKRPDLNVACLGLFVAKVTLRQAARTLGCNRKSVRRRVPLLGAICWAAHQHLAPRRDGAAFLQGGFLMDELETYATSRRNNPLTVPVLIHRASFFVLYADVGPLPRRGGKGRDEATPAPLTESAEAERNAGSKRAVAMCVKALAALVPEEGAVRVGTDLKPTYPPLLRAALGERLRHRRTHSKMVRNRRNPLFRINHTLAMLRDGVSRLVRETWAASKRARWLRWHLWSWIGYRNYVRGMTNEERHTTPAMKIGAATRQLRVDELLEWGPRWVGALLRA